VLSNIDVVVVDVVDVVVAVVDVVVVVVLLVVLVLVLVLVVVLAVVVAFVVVCLPRRRVVKIRDRVSVRCAAPTYVRSYYVHETFPASQSASSM
jgi:hypothetical protein